MSGWMWGMAAAAFLLMEQGVEKAASAYNGK